MCYQIYNEDCLIGMKRLEDNSVDLILTDLPYNLLEAHWDKAAIDLPTMWAEFNRILKPCSSALMFASSNFTFKLYNSNPEMFKYKLIWIKNTVTNFANAKNQPMHKYEEILVFSNGVVSHKGKSDRRMKYNPQGLIRRDKKCGGRKAGNVYGDHNGSLSHNYTQEYYNYPNDVLHFKRQNTGKQYHPTQKPVDLLSYLIRTYTDAGDVVLDATMGSGSTGVAAMKTNRRFIGYELCEKFFEIAKRRIDKAIAEREQSLFKLEA